MSSNVHRFVKAYIKTARPYYAFVTGIAGWAGIAVLAQEVSLRMIALLVILFTSWGVNQIFNDYLGLAEDRINTPNRPMVTGELHAPSALAVSITLVILTSLFVYYMSPPSLPFLIGAVLLNVVYEYSKGVPLLGNIIFGIMIAAAFPFAILFMDPKLAVMDLVRHPLLMASFVGIALSNGVMTYFTYFKDVVGDAKAGKHTLVVVMGSERAAKWGWFAAVLPFVPMAFLFSSPLLGFVEWSLLGVAFVFALSTAYRYYKHPTGNETHFNLARNFQACVAFQIAVLGTFQPLVGAVLTPVSIVGIQFLFNRHSDPKS